MTTEQEIKDAMAPIIADLMQKIESIKAAQSPAPAPDQKAIAAAEKAKVISEIAAWSGKQSNL